MEESELMIPAKAMILAAGLGSRMKPLTDFKPKALLEIQGTTLLEMSIRHLENFGVKEIIINVHHFSDQVVNFLKEKNNFGLRITISDESDELLDTGGGLKKVSGLFNDNKPFIVRNVDIVSDLDFRKMLEFHHQYSPLVTLAVRKRETSRYFLFDESNRLTGWTNLKTGKVIGARVPSGIERKLAFSGIQIIDPAIFQLITESGKFSLTDLYLRLAKDQTIIGYEENDSKWKDVGKSVNDLKVD